MLCRKESIIELKFTEDGWPIPNFHCGCGVITEGFSLCLKCDPQTYDVIPMKAVEIVNDGKEVSVELNVYAKEVWNAAIEAAMLTANNTPMLTYSTEYFIKQTVEARRAIVENLGKLKK